MQSIVKYKILKIAAWHILYDDSGAFIVYIKWNDMSEREEFIL